ncbi:bifunctional protein-serine/threonine kinase/phosphatase [Jiella sonneratiae]|uniref:Protein kinase n=1 Tax=Jiella sonneratiae TaxID=2816856 RepID=A0ABS3J7C8_9HYPH|nr:bifunctional protein-serine/threonine kinase/phosphatase [Jiella sonneratiae]MBO0905550.1 protein kinase [Jiella sonneratiae]
MTRPLLRSVEEGFPASSETAGKVPPRGAAAAADVATGAAAAAEAAPDVAEAGEQRIAVTFGSATRAGPKAGNQDFHGAVLPDGSALAAKGIAIAIADGISSSRHGRIAAETAVKSFLTDYYCTSDAWSVRQSASRVIAATNAWLHGETRRAAASEASPAGAEPDKGFVTTFSALVLKGRTAHLFHVGDTRVSRLSGKAFEPLTEDHRLFVSSVETYLARALGTGPNVEIDTCEIPLREGDVFLLTSDGVHEHLSPGRLAGLVAAARGDLDAAAAAILAAALDAGSRDDVTAAILRVDSLPRAEAKEWLAGGDLAPPAAIPGVGEIFDGWLIERALHVGPRSHVLAARDAETGESAALKFLASELCGEMDARRSLLMEEWIAARLSSRHCLKPIRRRRPRAALYTAMELVEGETLSAILDRNPALAVAEVRRIARDVAAGLQAMHRKDMVHQDLRPENVMIDRDGVAVLIDFGAARVAGVEEARPFAPEARPAGALQFSAPEQLRGEVGRRSSDVFSLGVLAYHMLTGCLPYGAALARSRTWREQRRLAYLPAGGEGVDVPDFVEGALARALAIDPARRYGEVAEFVHDLAHPNPAFIEGEPEPLAMRHPVRFWQAISAVLALIVIVLAGLLAGG